MDEVWKDMSLASTPAALHYSLSPDAYRDRQPHTALTLTHEPTCVGHAPSSGTAGPAPNSTGSGDDPLLRMPDPFAFSTFPDRSTNASRGAAVQAPERAGGDRRQRRIMKNRESAERSRARKQAYANEMELELAQLRRENTMLIKREQDLHVRKARLALAAAAAAQVPGRSTLQRCRSAPAP